MMTKALGVVNKENVANGSHGGDGHDGGGGGRGRGGRRRGGNRSRSGITSGRGGGGNGGTVGGVVGVHVQASVARPGGGAGAGGGGGKSLQRLQAALLYNKNVGRESAAAPHAPSGGGNHACNGAASARAPAPPRPPQPPLQPQPLQRPTARTNRDGDASSSSLVYDLDLNKFVVGIEEQTRQRSLSDTTFAIENPNNRRISSGSSEEDASLCSISPLNQQPSSASSTVSAMNDHRHLQALVHTLRTELDEARTDLQSERTDHLATLKNTADDKAKSNAITEQLAVKTRQVMQDNIDLRSQLLKQINHQILLETKLATSGGDRNAQVQLRDRQSRLRALFHASCCPHGSGNGSVCPGTKWGLPGSKCAEFQRLLQHLTHCQVIDGSCPVNSCQSAKQLCYHYEHCTKRSTCLLCAPILKDVARMKETTQIKPTEAIASIKSKANMTLDGQEASSEPPRDKERTDTNTKDSSMKVPANESKARVEVETQQMDTDLVLPKQPTSVKESEPNELDSSVSKARSASAALSSEPLASLGGNGKSAMTAMKEVEFVGEKASTEAMEVEVDEEAASYPKDKEGINATENTPVESERQVALALETQPQMDETLSEPKDLDSLVHDLSPASDSKPLSSSEAKEVDSRSDVLCARPSPKKSTPSRSSTFNGLVREKPRPLESKAPPASPSIGKDPLRAPKDEVEKGRSRSSSIALSAKPNSKKKKKARLAGGAQDGVTCADISAEAKALAEKQTKDRSSKQMHSQIVPSTLNNRKEATTCPPSSTQDGTARSTKPRLSTTTSGSAPTTCDNAQMEMARKVTDSAAARLFDPSASAMEQDKPCNSASTQRSASLPEPEEEESISRRDRQEVDRNTARNVGSSKGDTSTNRSSSETRALVNQIRGPTLDDVMAALSPDSDEDAEDIFSFGRNNEDTLPTSNMMAEESSADQAESLHGNPKNITSNPPGSDVSSGNKRKIASFEEDGAEMDCEPPTPDDMTNLTGLKRSLNIEIEGCISSRKKQKTATPLVETTSEDDIPLSQLFSQKLSSDETITLGSKSTSAGAPPKMPTLSSGPTKELSLPKKKESLMVKKKAAAPAAVAVSSSYLQNQQCRRLPDGSVRPKWPPTRGPDGRYERPPGRKSNGMMWNDTAGIWVPSVAAGNTYDKATAGAGVPIAPSTVAIQPQQQQQTGPMTDAEPQIKEAERKDKKTTAVSKAVIRRSSRTRKQAPSPSATQSAVADLYIRPKEKYVAVLDVLPDQRRRSRGRRLTASARKAKSNVSHNNSNGNEAPPAYAAPSDSAESGSGSLPRQILRTEPWKDLWPKLKAAGWTCRGPRGLEIDWHYYRPGKQGQKGIVEGEDFFPNSRAAEEYIQAIYNGDVGKGGVDVTGAQDKSKTLTSIAADKAPEKADATSVENERASLTGESKAPTGVAGDTERKTNDDTANGEKAPETAEDSSTTQEENKDSDDTGKPAFQEDCTDPTTPVSSCQYDAAGSAVLDLHKADGHDRHDEMKTSAPSAEKATDSDLEELVEEEVIRFRKENDNQDIPTETNVDSLASTPPCPTTDNANENQKASENNGAPTSAIAGNEMDLLTHASTCTDNQCIHGAGACKAMKERFEHLSSCTVGFVGGCAPCNKLSRLLKAHAFQCQNKDCAVLHCSDIRSCINCRNGDALGICPHCKSLLRFYVLHSSTCTSNGCSHKACYKMKGMLSHYLGGSCQEAEGQCDACRLAALLLSEFSEEELAPVFCAFTPSLGLLV